MLRKLPSPEPPVPAAPPTRRGGPEKHRGGAWKVAYADFVTALMALFIVLWMMNSGAKVKQSVSGYFKDPKGYTRKLGAGAGSSGEGLPVDRKNVRGIQDQIETVLRKMPEFQRLRNNILFTVTGEGLRIDLLENEQGMFFVTGNPTPTPSGEHLLEVLAEELGKMPNMLVIEGHTDARPFRNSTPSSRYSNWELSADRANAARRILHTYGVRPEQVVETRGFAAQHLLDPKVPDNPRNRRVSVVVRFQNGEGPPP
ncbi:MAG: OmpA family protein [Acidobacteriia bacterium]|nr:OmpA family protein [Terriglobia bacterium]